MNVVKIDRGDAQCVLDALCSSLDFGSGFLGTDEVVALRNLAKALGVDPITVTPSEFVGQHTHIPHLKMMGTHMYVRRGESLPDGWRWIETYSPGFPPGDRYAGRATMGDQERCMICEPGASGLLPDADAPIHRPWVDEYDLSELAGRCQCGALPDAHDEWRARGLLGHAYVDASVYIER